MGYTFLPEQPLNSFSLVDEGEEVFPRYLTGGSNQPVSGLLVLSYFYARKTETISRLMTLTNGTAGVSVTFAALGVYSIDSAGAATLVGQTASDTTLFGATFQKWTRNVITPFQKVRGQRYAFAHLVAASTMPNFAAVSANGHYSDLAPKLAAEVSGQASLPASITNAAQSPTGRLIQGFMLP
ncbi:hypothetical protein [Paractinoplanes maris]|uniref:hypothetical protein n=1 Tax=Paractinoplanes maris TaxID=1734446 RepID=UPI002020F260|nr:hypothetical protein [Actinoplanes maris]